MAGFSPALSSFPMPLYFGLQRFSLIMKLARNPPVPVRTPMESTIDASFPYGTTRKGIHNERLGGIEPSKNTSAEPVRPATWTSTARLHRIYGSVATSYKNNNTGLSLRQLLSEINPEP